MLSTDFVKVCIRMYVLCEEPEYCTLIIPGDLLDAVIAVRTAYTSEYFSPSISSGPHV